MRLEFVGKVNKKLPDGMMINVAHFTFPDSEIDVVVDRDETEWTVNDDGSYDMVWRSCYFWDGDHEYYAPLMLADVLNKMEVKLEIEDDAPADYEVTVEDFEAY